MPEGEGRVLSDRKLVIIRGNSGSGKSTIAEAIRTRRGQRDLAIIGQDNVRRIILKELDNGLGAHVGLIDTMARYALDHGYHVIIEGILNAERSREMFARLLADCAPSAWCFYLDIPFAETIRRHHTKPNAHEWTEDDMARWYRPHDALGVPGEILIGPESSFEASVARIGGITGLLHLPE